MDRSWTVENLDNQCFLPRDWDGQIRGTLWVAEASKAKRMTREEALHIVRSYPALNLCASRPPTASVGPASARQVD